MRTPLIIATLTALAAGQVRDALPKCSLDSLTTIAVDFSCTLDNVPCLCRNADAISTAITPAIAANCSPADQALFVDTAIEICKQHGIPIDATESAEVKPRMEDALYPIMCADGICCKHILLVQPRFTRVLIEIAAPAPTSIIYVTTLIPVVPVSSTAYPVPPSEPPCDSTVVLTRTTTIAVTSKIGTMTVPVTSKVVTSSHGYNTASPIVSSSTASLVYPTASPVYTSSSVFISPPYPTTSMGTGYPTAIASVPAGTGSYTPSSGVPIYTNVAEAVRVPVAVAGVVGLVGMVL